MDTALLWEFIIILVLILANGFFALSEFSIIASRRTKLKQLALQNQAGAKAAETLHQRPEKFLAAVQIGITLFGTLAGVVGGATIVTKLESFLSSLPVTFIASGASAIAVAIVAITITVVSVVIGELIPKYMALSNPESYARYVARPISVFIKTTAFLPHVLSGLAGFFVRLMGIKKGSAREDISEEEISLMVVEGRQKGVFDATEEKLIKSAFDFADSTVRRAMTPRTDVVAIEIGANPGSFIDTIIETGFSRYPVFKGTIDHIVGVLHTKDVIVHKLDPKLIILQDMIRPPVFVPDSMPLAKLLSGFQRKKNYMAMVLDEFGGTAGIVTLQDILEELVGELQDERDDEPKELIKQSERVAFADGSVWPGALNELMQSNLPEDQAETLAGLVIDRLGRIPLEDESIRIADMNITVVQKEKHRLSRLRLEKLPAVKEDDH